MTIISIDGVIVPAEQATISVLDRGLLYGDGAFEILRTWHGRAVELDRHLDRLFETVAALALRADRAMVAWAVTAAVAAAGVADHRIRIIVTRGPGSLAMPLAELAGGRTIVVVEALGPQPTTASAVTVEFPLARRTGRGHKTLAYLDHIVARELARAAGADEAIRLDVDGNVIEGATSNVFAVIEGVVVTPPVDTGALPGIVRGRVLELHDVVVRPLSRAEIVAANELFLTSSIKGVIGVDRLDGQPRAVGPVTTRIAGAYAACMRDGATI